MNKKFLSAILFGALMVTSTGTFVSCKDYDDDIENLQGQINSNKTAIEALQAQIKSGEWVSGVTTTDNGIVVTLGNGTSYTITNGTNGEAGEAGKDGATPKIAVNDGMIQVSYDNGTTWTDLIALEELKGEKGDQGEQGTPGTPGTAAETPIFSVGEDGHIYVQYGEDGEKKDLGVSTGGIYCVEQGVKVTIHIPNEAGEYQDVVLPTAASISSISAVTVNKETATLTDGVDIKLYYGVAAAEGKYFDGTAFAAGDILLPTAEANGAISAQINPTIADATKYDFYLIDSKGNSIFDLGEATSNMTENPLSRAATANKGIYDMPITFVSGVTETMIKDVKSSTYAIATTDAYDNEVLSAYDVTVAAEEAGAVKFEAVASKNVEVNKSFNLNDLVEMANVIDVQYYFSKGQTAAVDAAGATISSTSIQGSVAGKSVKVSYKYMDATGAITPKEDAITITFINSATENAYTQTLVLKAEADDNKLVFDVTSLIGNTVASAPNFFTIGDAKFTAAAKDKNTDEEYAKGAEAVGITAPEGVSSVAAANPANGYYKHTLTYTVNNATVLLGTYEAVLTYGSNPTNKVTLTLIVKDQTDAYNFKPLDLYFNGTKATAYGTPNGTQIAYNLKGLFGTTDWDNVTFTETVPKEYTDADGIKWTANAWLGTGKQGDIVVDKVKAKTGDKTGNFGGAYEVRSLKATYEPFGNKNLAATVFDFALTIKSSVFEGSLNYVKKVAIKDADGKVTGYKYETGDDKVIKVANADAKATLTGGEIRGITKTAVTYFANADLAKAHVVSATAALEGENAKQYLTISGDFENGYTITPNANVTIPADGKSVECVVRVSVVDEWGKTKTVDVPVILK